MALNKQNTPAVQIHIGKAVVMKQVMDDDMAAFAINEASLALETYFKEKVSIGFQTQCKQIFASQKGVLKM